MNGVAMSLAAGSSLSPLELMAMDQRKPPMGAYPPALTGMRGSHPGSFEVAHSLILPGANFARPSQQTDETYDLVVVGGGISGLSAAFFYRQRVGPDAKILVLDNHDDFGGHAKRNEFKVGGKTLIGYGGSQSIDGPANYSAAAKQLLKDVGIETQRFYDYHDKEYFKKRNLGSAIWFSQEAYGKDVLAQSAFRDFLSTPNPASVAAAVETYPISNESKKALLDLLQNDRDYLADLSRTEKIELLRKTSYRDYLLKHIGATQEVADLFNDTTRGYWGVGWDALSALEGYRLGNPGTANLDTVPGDFACCITNTLNAIAVLPISIGLIRCHAATTSSALSSRSVESIWLRM